MGLLIITIILFAIVITVLSIGITSRKLPKASVLIAFVVPMILLFGMFTKVNANEVGIIYDDRYGVIEEVKTEGFQMKSIFEHITPIQTAVKTVTLGTSFDEDLGGQTKDSVYARFVTTISYRIQALNAGKFFKVTGKTDLTPDQLNAATKQALQKVTIQYDVYSLLSKELENARMKFEQELERILMDEYYITLTMASFDDIDAGDLVETVIQQKAEAQQNVEIAIANQEKAKIENETLIMNAQAQADAIKIGADAEAYKVAAEKEAVANLLDYYKEKLPNLTETQISNLVLSVLYYSKWDGVLPKVTDGSNVIVGID